MKIDYINQNKFESFTIQRASNFVRYGQKGLQDQYL